MNAAFFLAWLFFYYLAGEAIGAALGHPTAGAVLGTIVGIFPSAVLCFASHYSVLAIGVFPFIIIYAMVPPPVRFWIAIVCGALPLVFTVGMTIFGFFIEKPKKKRKKGKKSKSK